MTYVNKVAEYFLERKPEMVFINAMDYTLVAEWEKQTIPLEVVLRTINECLANQDVSGIKIESVTDCQESVRKNFNVWLQTRQLPGTAGKT